jgi:large subunit ribosomal protein L29
MTKAAELREMSDEQLSLSLKESCESFFRLRLQAQTERLDAPSELRKQRREIARIKTIVSQRATAAEAVEKAANQPATAVADASQGKEQITEQE